MTPEDQAAEEMYKNMVAAQEYFERMPDRLKSIDDMLQTPEIDWLVEKRIHRAGLTQFYGPSYSGKTLVALDLALSVAAGLTDWMGLPLNTGGEPQAVVYVAAEGGPAFAVHIDAWLKAHPEVSKERLYRFFVLDGGQGDHVFITVNEKDAPIAAEYSWFRFKTEVGLYRNRRPVLVVWDTQVDIAPYVDENSNRDVVEVLRQIKRDADANNYMAVVIHHTGHEGTRARGASGQKAKCDVQASVQPSAKVKGKGTIEWIKVKGAAQPDDKIGYQIGSVEGSTGAVVQAQSALATATMIHNDKRPPQSDLDNVLRELKEGQRSANAISKKVGLSRAKVEGCLPYLRDEGFIEIEGEGTGRVIRLV